MARPAKPSMAGSKVMAAGHHQDHHGDGTDGQAPHERKLQQKEPEQREDDREPANTTALPGGGQRHGHGLPGLPLFGQSLAVAGDDEQGVVNAHTESDHGHDLRCEHGGGHHVGHEIENGKPDGDTEEAR